jgi:SH3-like domain-containing protein
MSLDATGQPDARSRGSWPLARRLARGAMPVLLAMAFFAAGLGPGRDASGDAGAPNLPRFMSLKSSPANVRRGPGRDHEILWVYNQPLLPVEVIAEHQDWRRIRDWEGDEGWVFQALLTSRRRVIVVGSAATLHREPDPGAAAVAIAEPGVVGDLLACRSDWCEIDAGGHEGWVQRTAIWGVYPHEVFEED